MSRTPEKRPAYEPPTRLLRPTGYDPDMKRPASTYAGVALVMLRVVAGIVMLVGIALGWHGVVIDLESIDGFDDSDVEQLTRGIIVGVGAVFVVLDALFAFFVFRGSNIARVIVMFFAVASIATSFVAWWVQGQDITLQTTFVSLSLDILILLALSSRSAAAYARRNERR
ncbi:hypothetical protein [Microbacterium sp. SLBN-146]|uniref:hypothetical protein n=1 Tax=Microbacterium sp. SLBN-146 TaxID=2768457 RepID=UPI00115001C6|nr:hypothetical protein [Microbacterium sp. SLBN-146]